MKPVYKLLTNFLLLIAILFVLDRGLGALIEYYLLKEKQGDSSITAHALMRTKEDIVVFGSSRAAHHYVTNIFHEQTGLSCYNVGKDGVKMLYYEAILKGMLSYHQPKIIILDLNLSDFEGEEDEQQRVITSLLPFFGRNEEVRRQIYNSDKIEFYKAKLSWLYRVNSMPSSIIQHHLGIGQKNENGYEPLKGNRVKFSKMQYANNINYKESQPQVEAFERFVEAVTKKGIKLYVFVSPIVKTKKFNAVNTADKVLNKYGLKCYDYSKLYDISSIDLFYDMSHLNKNGAEQFTKKLISDHFQKSQ